MCDFQKNIDAITVSMYDVKEISTPNGGDMMTSREILTAALKATGKFQAEGARLMGQNPQWLSAKLVRNSLRADEFLTLLDKLGIDVTFTIRETGAEVMEQNKGAGEILTTVLEAIGKSKAEGARLMGQNPQWLIARLARNSLRADEFLDLLDRLGTDVTFTVRETGAEVRERIKGAGRRVRKMVNRTIYDTAACDALSNNFYADGKNEYTDGRAMELYIDAEGRYFFAEYTEDGNGDRITVASPEETATFISKHGTEIEKAPIE